MKIPAQIRELTGGAAEINIDQAETVGELLSSMKSAYPTLTERMLDDNGEIRRFVNIYVGDEDVRFLDGVDTPLDGKEVVSILPAVAGG